MSTSRRAARVASMACFLVALPAFATDDLPFGGSHTSKTYFGRGGDTGPYGPVQPKTKNPWTATIFGIRCCQTPEEKCARFQRQYQIVQAKHAVEMNRLNWKKYENCQNGGCNDRAGFIGNVDGNPNSRSVWAKRGHGGKCDGCGNDACGGCEKSSWGLLAKGNKGGCDSCGSSCSTGCDASGWRWADSGCANGGCTTAGCSTGNCGKSGCGKAGCSSCGGAEQVGWFKSAGVCDGGKCGHSLTWGQRGHCRANKFQEDATRNYGVYPGMNREDAVRYLEGMQYYPPYQLIRSPRDFYMFDVKYGVGR